MIKYLIALIFTFILLFCSIQETDRSSAKENHPEPKLSTELIKLDSLVNLSYHYINTPSKKTHALGLIAEIQYLADKFPSSQAQLHLYELKSLYYAGSDLDSSLFYANNLIEFYQNTDSVYNVVRGLQLKGFAYFASNKMEAALENYLESLDYLEGFTEDSRSVEMKARSHFFCSYIHYISYNYDIAREHVLKNMNLSSKDPEFTATILHGHTLAFLINYKGENYEECKNILEQIKRIDNAQKWLQIFRFCATDELTRKGIIPEMGIDNYKIALSLLEEFNFEEAYFIRSFDFILEYLIRNENFQLAESILVKLKESKKGFLLDFDILQEHEFFAKIYQGLKDNSRLSFYQEQMISLRDSIEKSDIRFNTMYIEKKNEIENVKAKRDELRIENMKNEVENSELQRKLTFLILCFITISSISLFFYLKYKYHKSLKDRLEELVQERTNSLNFKTRELSNANVELDRLNHILCHELRSPVITIKGYIDFLKNFYFKSLDERGNTILKNLEISTIEIDNVIEDVQSYLNLKREKPVPEEINLRELTEDVLQDLESSIIKSNANFIIKELPTVVNKKTFIQLILNNLIKNAINHKNGTTIPLIEISSEKLKNDAWKVYVKDNGRGISKENKMKILSLFHNLNPENFSSTGISLALTKRLIENIDGEFGFNSKENEGSIFWFTFTDLKTI